MQRCHSDEMQTLQQQLHQKNDAAFKKYRMAIKESLSKPDNTVVTNEQVFLCTSFILFFVLNDFCTTFMVRFCVLNEFCATFIVLFFCVVFIF